MLFVHIRIPFLVRVNVDMFNVCHSQGARLLLVIFSSNMFSSTKINMFAQTVIIQAFLRDVTTNHLDFVIVHNKSLG